MPPITLRENRRMNQKYRPMNTTHGSSASSTWPQPVSEAGGSTFTVTPCASSSGSSDSSPADGVRVLKCSLCWPPGPMGRALCSVPSTTSPRIVTRATWLLVTMALKSL